MRKLLLVFILLCGKILILHSQDPCVQLNYHAFKAENVTGTYMDLGSLGTVIDVSEHDDGLSEPQDIGFTFEYMCQDFTQFIFSTNGFIKLGSEPLSNTDLFFSNSQSNSRGVFNSDTIADIKPDRRFQS